MNRLLLVAGALLCALFPLFAQQQEPASKEDLDQVKEALNGINESAAEYRGYVDALRKIKITGYLQPQFRLTDNLVSDFPSAQQYLIGNFSGGKFPTNAKNLFQVRRGRLKVNYDNDLTQFVIQIDAVQTGFTTKDAFLSVIEPWTRSVGFQFGIFDRPFGYEISYSSSNRETPERSRLFQTLFPNERELGAKLFYAPPSGSLSFLRADLGVFNGSGPIANEYDNFKDIIGRVGAQVPFTEANAELDFGVSGYFGKVRNNTKFLFTPGTLANGLSGFQVDSTASNLSDGVDRTYIGVDAQFYIDIPQIGGAILRGEYITGKQPGAGALSPLSSSTTSPQAQITTPIYKRNFAGWYIQNIGAREQLVFDYDVYDPNTDVSASNFMANATSSNTSGATGLSAADVKYTTLGFGFIHHWDDNVKFLVYYEIIQNEKLDQITLSSSPLLLFANNLKDNVFTFRVQYKF
jgi:hypothetical protein